LVLIIFIANGDLLPLAIMTSADTHDRTEKLLNDNNYFGLKQEQVTLIKQGKVPALANNDAHFAQVEGKLELLAKPHGHGDVHTLVH